MSLIFDLVQRSQMGFCLCLAAVITISERVLRILVGLVVRAWRGSYRHQWYTIVWNSSIRLRTHVQSITIYAPTYLAAWIGRITWVLGLGLSTWCTGLPWILEDLTGYGFAEWLLCTGLPWIPEDLPGYGFTEWLLSTGLPWIPEDLTNYGFAEWLLSNDVIFLSVKIIHAIHVHMCHVNFEWSCMHSYYICGHGPTFQP